MQKRLFRAASTSWCIGIALLLVMACGSTEEQTTQAATGGAGANSGSFCTTPAPACLITIDLGGGSVFQSCQELHTELDTPILTFQSDCKTPSADPDETKTFLPDGCPRDDALGCGLVTEVVGSYGINFIYVSGDPLVDDNSPCKTSCPNAEANNEEPCCPGSAFP